MNFSKLFCLGLCLLLNPKCHAQWVNVGPGGDALSGVSFRSPTDGWVCGANGALFHTRDGGTTWQGVNAGFQTAGPRSHLISVTTLYLYDVQVLAQQPDSILPTQVFYSERNGLDFKPAVTGGTATSDFAQMSFHTYKLGLLVGAGGAFRFSRAQGQAWNQVPSGTLNDLWAADSPDGVTYFLVGSKGTLRKGSQYEPVSKALNSGTFARLTGVWFVDVNQGYVVGDGGTARRTIDGGLTWTPMPVNTTVNLNAVRFLDANTGFIVGDLGTLLLTTDGGKSWKPEASNTFETLTAISATDDGLNTWIVGGNGTVLKRGAVVPLASRGLTLAPQWEAYPNPFTTSLTLTFPAGARVITGEVALLDQLGRTVLEQSLALGTTSTAQISLLLPASLAPGVYTLRLALPGQLVINRRLVHLP